MKETDFKTKVDILASGEKMMEWFNELARESQKNRAGPPTLLWP